MYYRVKLQRVENGTVWVTPGYFRSKVKAGERAKFWDSFHGKKYDKVSTRIWQAQVIKSSKRPKHQRKLT